MNNSDRCPYCHKSACIPEHVYRNIESYGSKKVNFKCSYCKKVITSFGSVRVQFTRLSKTKNKSDW